MARDDKENDELRPRPLGFRVSEAEYAAVNLLARWREVSVADLLRERVNMADVVEEADRIRELVRAG